MSWRTGCVGAVPSLLEHPVPSRRVRASGVLLWWSRRSSRRRCRPFVLGSCGVRRACQPVTPGLVTPFPSREQSLASAVRDAAVVTCCVEVLPFMVVVVSSSTIVVPVSRSPSLLVVRCPPPVVRLLKHSQSTLRAVAHRAWSGCWAVRCCPRIARR